MFRIQTHYKLVAVLLFVLSLSVLSGGKAHAASIAVAAGSDETVVNSNCSLSEAITNINNGDATSYPECAGTGAFGTGDTIVLPAGTITQTADLVQITRAVTLQGQGIGSSIIDGSNGSYVGLIFQVNEMVALKDFKIQAFKAAAIQVNQPSLDLQHIEIDGTNALPGPIAGSGGADVLGGIRYSISTAAQQTVDLDGLYVHDLNASTAAYMVGFSVNVDGGANLQLSVKNSTIANIHSTSPDNPQFFGVQVGLVPGSTLSGALFENVTIYNISSTSSVLSSALQFAGFSFNQGPIDMSAILRNVTIYGFRATGSSNSAVGGLLLVGGGSVSSDIVNIHVTAQNLLIADSTVDGQQNSCNSLDASSFFGGGGVYNGSLVSQGGNLSDNSTCSSSFNQSTDQNNLTNLVSTLGTLSYHGGYVPVIPLLQGSPAIDSGVTVAGLTTDARLAVRPQGSAYDSGAYESPFTKPKLASTGQSVTLYMLAALSMLTLALGGIAYRVHDNI